MTTTLIQEVGICVAGASVAGFAMYKLRLPLLLGYILAGMILGPKLGFGLVIAEETITTLSELGFIFLMYILGMEIDVKKLLRAGKAVSVNGLTQFLGCAGLAWAFFSALGFSFSKSDFSVVYLAVACGLSSTLVVVKILSDRVELDTLTSRITLGILVVQDLWAIAFLAAQPNLHLIKDSVLLVSLLKASGLILMAVVIAKYVLPKIFQLVAKQVELILIVALGWCFLVAQTASSLGLSREMGALIAGVSIASFPYHVLISVKIASLRDFFVTLFFVALGLRFPVPDREVLILSSAIVGFVLLSRLLTVYPVLWLLKYGNRGSLIPAINLSQVSEFSLVIVSLGVTYQHIPESILSAFIIALVVTAPLSTLLITRSHQIYQRLNPLLEKLGMRDHIDLSAEETKASPQAKIVFLGFFREASSILTEIESRHSKEALSELMVFDLNPDTIKKLKARGIQGQYGDIGHIETLKDSAVLTSASIIICSVPDSVLRATSNSKLLRAMRDIAPGAKIIVTAETIPGALALYEEGADYVVLPRLVTAHYFTDILERIESGNAEIVRENSLAFLRQRKEILR